MHLPVLAEAIHVQEIHSPWTFAAVCVVLLHQFAIMWIQTRSHRVNSARLKQLCRWRKQDREELLNIRLEQDRLREVVRLLARGIGGPQDPPPAT